MKTAAIFGSSGAIGSALIRQLALRHTDLKIHAFSRKKHRSEIARISTHELNDYSPSSLEAIGSVIQAPLDLAIVATGILHNEAIKPEKSLRAVSSEKLAAVFAINTILPTLLAQQCLPLLNRQAPSYFAVLSARVGSISNNQLGGWYAYRASKAALNMMIKTMAIETRTRNRHAVIVGLHPGTVASDLSQPFLANAPRVFSPETAATHLLDVIEQLRTEDSGQCFAWDGKVIEP